MSGSMLFLTGIIFITAGSLSASDVCREEIGRLREQERVLKSKLSKQQLLIHSLQLQGQPPHTHGDTQGDSGHDALSTDCSQVFSSGSRSSGAFRVRPALSPSPLTVFCDMTDGGGWSVIQRRTNGTESFNRSWSEYKEGFGDMDSAFGEFWLGNDNLHYITAQGNYSLRIYLEDFDGNQRYADYKDFRVADEKDQYRLSFGAYSGTAGDALSGRYQLGVSEWAGHQGAPFSTHDRDNDNYRGNCAAEDKGGWWFNKCHSAHLNGLYYPKGHYSSATDDGIVWYPWRGWWYSLRTSVMKIRPQDFKMDPMHDPNAVHNIPPA